MVYLTKKVHFSASHVLKSAKLTPKENEKTFGKKSSLHGHNYILEVTIQGKPDERTGLFFDFARLTETIEQKVLSHVNYKHFDETSFFLEGMNPTAENLVKAFWKNLEPAFPKGTLYEIKLQQADSETVTYRGEA